MSAKYEELYWSNQKPIKLFKNQKAIETNKLPTGNSFLQINSNEWTMASRALKDCAFRMYMYMCDNQHGYRYGLSPSDVCQELGISERSYRNAVNELIEKGYLVEYTGKEKLNYDYYMFYSTPLKYVSEKEYDYTVEKKE